MNDDDELWLFKPSSDQRDIDAVTNVLQRETWWVKGEEIEQLEDEVASRVGRDYGVAFNSGTSALFALLSAYGVESSEVIVPSYTFAATPNSVELAGGKAVFADIEADTMGLSASDVRSKISSDTSAVMPIHFSGNVSRDINEIREICENEDLILIEDACHSLGASKNGTAVGDFGDAAMFSFCFNKIISTGEGGMIVTDDPEIVDELKLLRSHGCDRSGDEKDYVKPGFNLRMSSINAALGLTQVSKLDSFIEQRQELANIYFDNLSGISEIDFPAVPDDTECVFQLFNILVETNEARDALQDHLEDNGIPSRITYTPMHTYSYYEAQDEQFELPKSEYVSNHILTLPMYPHLPKNKIDKIGHAIRDFFE